MSLDIHIDPGGRGAQAEKERLRLELLHRRQVIPQDLKSTTRWKVINNLRTLHSQLSPAVVGVYSPIKDEIDLMPWVEELWENEEIVALPRVVEREHPLVYNIWEKGDPLEPDAVGVPCATGPEVIPAFMAIPTLGYNRHGYRLGYGGGYFDITLKEMGQQTVTVGVAYTAMEVEHFPCQYHDQRLQYFVTGKEVITCL